MSDFLQPHGLQHTRLPCPSPTPGACSKLMSIKSVMPSNHLILCRPLCLLPSGFPSIRVFFNDSVLRIRWPKYWSFSISPSSEYSDQFPLGLTSLISLQPKGLSGVFSNTTVQKHEWYERQKDSSKHRHISDKQPALKVIKFPFFLFWQVRSLDCLLCHLHNKKKDEQMENQQLLLDPAENPGHRANFCPSNRRGKQTQYHNLPGADISARASARVGKPDPWLGWITGDSVWARFRVKNVVGPDCWASPHLCLTSRSTRFS